MVSVFKDQDRKVIRRWCVSGIVCLVIFGFIWHEIFNWTGVAFIGALAPVNESVWEHLKMGYWGLVFFSGAEYFFLRKRVSNYFTAKLGGLFIISFTILFIFYTYTFFTGHSILFIDIGSYVLGITLCQWFSYKLCTAATEKQTLNRLSLILFILIGVLFAVFTFYPPPAPLFEEHVFSKFILINDLLKSTC